MGYTGENKCVSVIIPVYNVQAYLDKCIQSVVMQTYHNMEIILVDDGSVDNSLAICRRWAAEDLRINVLSHDNHGVSYSRNVGLENSHGDYVTFVDADDVLSEHYVETLVDLMEKDDADMSIVSFSSFYEGTSPVFTHVKMRQKRTHDLETIFYSLTSGVVCGKLYNRSVIECHNIRFDPNIAVTEDLLFNFLYVKFCSLVVYNPSALYGYLQRRCSAAHHTVSAQWFTCLLSYRYLAEQYCDSAVYGDVVYYYLKNLYESRYYRKHRKIEPSEIPVDLDVEIQIYEHKRNMLPIKRVALLWVHKWFFGLILWRRERKWRNI